MESVFLNERGSKQTLNYHKKYCIFKKKDKYFFFRICSLAQVEILTNKLLLVVENKRKIFLVLCAEK